MNRSSRFRPEIFIIVLLFLTAGALRLNDLLVYTPDSARYLIWGNSIASGEGYVDDTQPEDLRFVIHAPLYPALISPVEFFFPLSVEPVKIFTLCLGATALVLLWLWLQPVFGRWPALAGTLMLAVNPLFLVYSTEPLSEVPFIVFFLVILLFSARLAAGRRPAPPEWLLLAGVCALIGLLREIGVVIWIGFAGWLFLRERKKSLVVLAAGVVTLGAWYIRNNLLVGHPAGSPGGNAGLLFQHLLTGQDESIFKEFFMRLKLNLGSYGPDLLGMLFYPFHGPQHVALTENPVQFPAALKWTTVILFGGVILRGIRATARAGSSERFMLTAAAGFIAAAALYPVHDIRFMVPLLPVMIYLVIAGLRPVAALPAIRTGLVVGVSLLVFIPNLFPIHDLLRINGAYRESPTKLHAALTAGDEYPFYYTQPWELLRGWIDENVPDHGVFATPTKELALITGGRKVMELDPGLTQTIFERLLRTNGVTHLLAPVRWRDMKVYEFLMGESRRLSFREIFSVSNLHIMEVGPGKGTGGDAVSAGRAAGPAGPEPTGEPDAAGDLRSARAGIKAGDYSGALRLLDAASEIAPLYPEIRYQTVVAYALAGDSIAATAEFTRLMTLPQVASYIFPARYYLVLMENEAYIKRMEPGPEKQMRTLELARRYWDNGYAVKARGMLTAEMYPDTSYFVGHLWAFHFNFQTGNDSLAEHFLARLDAIDSSNGLVKNFHRITRLRREIRGLTGSPERSSFRLRMAEIYRDIELFDEAYDEAEAAVADDPENSGAALFLAGLYEQQGYSRRALSLFNALLLRHGNIPGLRQRVDSLSALSGHSE